MEAMVELPTIGREQIAHWLSETAGSQEAAVRTATSHLEAAQNVPKFALCLLMLAAGNGHIHIWSPLNSTYMHASQQNSAKVNNMVLECQTLCAMWSSIWKLGVVLDFPTVLPTRCIMEQWTNPFLGLHPRGFRIFGRRGHWNSLHTK